MHKKIKERAATIQLSDTVNAVRHELMLLRNQVTYLTLMFLTVSEVSEERIAEAFKVAQKIMMPSQPEAVKPEEPKQEGVTDEAKESV